MTVEELISRFPEVPPVLRREPFLERFAATFDEPLRRAARPSNCAGSEYAPENLLYVKLIIPMDILNVFPLKPDKVIAELEGHVAAYAADADGWMADVVPSGTREKPGGCEGE